MRILLLSILLISLLNSHSSFSQNTYHPKLSKRDNQKFLSAKSAHKKKQLDEALKQYCKLLNKYAGHPELEIWTGLAYKDKGETDEALQHLTAATNNIRLSSVSQILRFFFAVSFCKKAGSVIG